ncbi:MAG: type II toxin-antitoxin system HicA family toxin [Ignavibacteriaceae bacterium]
MPKLYSAKEIETVLKSFGFIFLKQKGSHGKFKNEKGSVAILPMNKKEIPLGTFRSILKQASISLDEFKQRL